MIGIYGGLMIVLLYGPGGGSGPSGGTWLITQSNIDITTQTSDRILVQP